MLNVLTKETQGVKCFCNVDRKRDLFSCSKIQHAKFSIFETQPLLAWTCGSHARNSQEKVHKKSVLLIFLTRYNISHSEHEVTQAEQCAWE